MKIALILNSRSGGGAEAVGQTWYQVFTLLGLEPVRMYVSGPAKDACTLKGKSHLRRLREVRSRVKDGGFQVAVGIGTYPNLLASLSGAPHTILSEHTIPSILLRRKGWTGRLQLFIARLYYRRASAVIGVSHAVLTDLRVVFRVSSDKLFLIRNAVGENENSTTFTPPSDTSKRSLHLLVPGRVSPEKRPELALVILRTLLSDGIDAKLSFIGTLEMDPISPDSTLEPHIEYVAWQSDWWHLASNKTIVLLPSDVEGYGNVLVQAAQANLPVVAFSSALGVGDSVIDGVSGALAANTNPSEWGNAIDRAAAMRGRVEVPKDWLERHHVGQVQQAFERLLAGLGVTKQLQESAKQE